MLSALRSFNQGGAAGFFGFLERNDALADDFVMYIQEDLPNGGEWRGRDGFERMIEIWMEAWDEFEIHPHDPVEVGEGRYLVPVRQHVVAKGMGLELEEEFFYTVELEDGLYRRVGLYAERELAERALAAS